MRKTVGIIGGLGPESTAEFYLDVIRSAKEVYPEAYPHIVIDNVPVPFDLEHKAVLYGRGVEEYGPLLVESARRLESDGVDFITLPCNTVHEVYGEIQEAVSVPVVNILEVTARECSRRGIDRLAVLGTRRTVGKDLYGPSLKRFGIARVELEAEEVEELSELIYRLLAGGGESGGEGKKRDRVFLLGLIEHLAKRGAEAVILGCTDLQLLVKPGDEDLPVPAVDSVEALVGETVRRLGE